MNISLVDGLPIHSYRWSILAWLPLPSADTLSDTLSYFNPEEKNMTSRLRLLRPCYTPGWRCWVGCNDLRGEHPLARPGFLV